MNEDMPWVNLTQEEVDELRTKKHELTEYGKDKIRELMKNQEPYPDAMFEEAERRERSNSVLARYNNYYNIECAALAHGTPITPEFQQAMALECMIAALRCENLNREYNEIAISDIEDLIEALYNQGRESLKKWEEFEDSANGVA
jgi:hypothetical protein